MGINFISIGRLWLVGRSKNVVAISNLSYDVSCSLLALIPNFIQIGQKTQKLKNFQCWSVLVGRAGRSKNGRRHFELILCCFCPIISPHTKFHPNRMKNMEVENFHFWSVLVGRTGRSKKWS